MTVLHRLMRCSVALWLTSWGVAHAGAGAVADDRQAQLTAAYIFNFVKFVEWPQTVASETLEVCFLGAREIHDALAASAAAKQSTSRRIVVREVQVNQSVANCQVVYVRGPRDKVRAPQALTIGESEDFTRSGGIIRLYTESNRLRFIINVDNAKREGIHLSSNLLKLATHVEQGVPR